MTLARVVEAIAEQTGLPKTKVSQVLKTFFKVVCHTVLSGEAVTLIGFGRFYPVDEAGRKWFGGKFTGNHKKRIRFKERRVYGEARRRRQRREDEDCGGGDRQVP